MTVARPRLVFDIGASKQYEGRPAVGILRTERELVKAALIGARDASYVYFESQSKAIREVDPEYARQLVSRGKPASGRRLEYGYQFEFRSDDIVVNCGLPWDNDSLSCYYWMKRKVGFSFIQVIYDIIPVIMPEYCVPGMQERFPKFLNDAASVSTCMYCISNSTMNDLAKFYANHEINSPPLRRIALGIDSLEPSRDEDGYSANEGCVLFVSSIEPRKNHQFIFSVWQRLFEKLGDRLPQLLLVGSQGWNTNELRSIIENSNLAIKNKIKFAPHLDDIQLDILYRRCLFTVYPSLYEGWGLPISECLAYGKFCIASNTSSMPEASQGLLELLDPKDFYAWVSCCEHFILNIEELKVRTNNVMKKRLIRGWSENMHDFLEDVVRNIA